MPKRKRSTKPTKRAAEHPVADEHPVAVGVSMAINLSVDALEQLSNVQRRAFMCGIAEVIGAMKGEKKHA